MAKLNYQTMQRDEESAELSKPAPSSFHSSLTPLLSSKVGDSISPKPATTKTPPARQNERDNTVTNGGGKSSVLYIIIYGVVNSIMAIPCIFGYAAVIFNNPAFNPYINELSKVVLWSSVVHQFAFTAFSSLPFAIGQVQDAGLIFLSHMSNTMANKIIDEGGTAKEAVSTALVVLSLATASTGVILILMGKFRLADLVSYLPLPVVGGYLACEL